MSRTDCTLTADQARQILVYDGESGEFRWASNGLPAGGVCSQGYWRIKIFGKSYKGHRLAWLIIYGSWPVEMVDHINMNRLDNRQSNLRLATNSQNQQNRSKASSHSAHGFLGVTWNCSAKRWSSRIMLNSKRVHLGYFESAEAASAAYLSAKREMHSFSTI